MHRLPLWLFLQALACLGAPWSKASVRRLSVEDAADQIQLQSLELKLNAQLPVIPETPKTSPRLPFPRGKPEGADAGLQPNGAADMTGYSDISQQQASRGAEAQDESGSVAGAGDLPGIGVSDLWLPCMLSPAQAAEYR